MDQASVFSYTYSARDNQEVLRIRDKYLPKQEDPLTTLKTLDARVKRPAEVFAYIFGSVDAIIMGTGMSLVMTDVGAYLGITQTMPLGIAVGLVGMGLALLTYPLYKSILKGRKRKYAQQILELSENILRD